MELHTKRASTISCKIPCCFHSLVVLPSFVLHLHQKLATVSAEELTQVLCHMPRGVMRILNTGMPLATGQMEEATPHPTKETLAHCSGTAPLPGPSSRLMKSAEGCAAHTCPDGAQGAPVSEPQAAGCTPSAPRTSPGTSGNAASWHLCGSQPSANPPALYRGSVLFLVYSVPVRWAQP